MEWYLAMALLLGTVCVAMFLGLPVALAFFAANVLGTFLFINGDIVTGTHCIGYSICIAGMLWYAHPTAHKPRGSSLPK